MEVHHHAHTERKKWHHYFWEFFMLFLAVTLGLFSRKTAGGFYGTCVDVGGNRAATVSGTMNFCGQSAAFIFLSYLVRWLTKLVSHYQFIYLSLH